MAENQILLKLLCEYKRKKKRRHRCWTGRWAVLVIVAGLLENLIVAQLVNKSSIMELPCSQQPANNLGESSRNTHTHYYAFKINF
jgi:hypothetical protein